MTRGIDDLTLPKTTASDGEETDPTDVLLTDHEDSTDIFYGKFGITRGKPKNIDKKTEEAFDNKISEEMCKYYVELFEKEEAMDFVIPLNQPISTRIHENPDLLTFNFSNLEEHTRDYKKARKNIAIFKANYRFNGAFNFSRAIENKLLTLRLEGAG